MNRMASSARRAADARRWPEVRSLARRILKADSRSAEGHFLLGLAQVAGGQASAAGKSFSRSMSADAGRYDAAVERAALMQRAGRHAEAVALVAEQEAAMQGSPRYLDRAATIYQRAGLPALALPLFERALALQPGADALAARLAECYVFAGRLSDARALYEALIAKRPDHPKNHFELARLNTATDDAHIRTMQAIVARPGRAPAEDVYLLYAIGKELEDLERWDDAFDHFERAGQLAANAGGYDVSTDIAVIEAIADRCTSDWLAATPAVSDGIEGTEIFVTGLPRSGSTLIERILASHSAIESAGESFFLPSALREAAGGAASVTPEVIRRAATADPADIAGRYRQSIGYRLEGLPFYIDKLPENFLYLGFCARSFPDARLLRVRRHPMDNAFALFKQSWFRFAYRLDDLARYLVAHERLGDNWQSILGDRLIEIRYEALVRDQRGETERLLAAVGVGFETACLEFERHAEPTNTASAAQVREKLHDRSVGRWRHFAHRLGPLLREFEAAGIDLS